MEANRSQQPSKSKQPMPSKPQPQVEFEFFGPKGAVGIMIALPIVVLCLAHWSRVGHVDLGVFEPFLPQRATSTTFWKAFVSSAVFCPKCRESATVVLWSEGDGGVAAAPAATTKTLSLPVIVWCMMALIGWFAFQVLLERCLPCELVPGAPIAQHPDNQIRLTYRINGHLAFWCTLLLVTVGWPVYESNSNAAIAAAGGAEPSWQLHSFPFWSLLYENFAELAFACIILCFVLNTYLYLDSFSSTRENGATKILAAGGNTGYVLYDYFIGRELNPRLFQSFDWKEFCELRPGLMGWMLLNAAAAHEQYKVYGAISGSMYLVNIFHGIYVWDALYQEKAILTTMDITTDGFGFMLVFGDLCWVPFTYSLQARYLVHNDPHLMWWQLLAIVAIHLVGYTIFRSANGQKDAFRRDPSDASVAHLKYLPTRRGTKLLISGWWGLARKINYTGDYIMGLSWCLVCGFGSIVPYFYAIYFFILLVHRSGRDDHMCLQKYGDDWITYKKMVPYRFIPGVV